MKKTKVTAWLSKPEIEPESVGKRMSEKSAFCELSEISIRACKLDSCAPYRCRCLSGITLTTKMGNNPYMDLTWNQ
jgi:hypothetical protein